MDIDHNCLYEALSRCCLSLRLTSKEEHRLEATADFSFPANFAGFQGHFPGNPILPAIVQLTAVRFLAERSLGQRIEPTFHSKIKFKGVIQPEEQVTVNIVLQNNGMKWDGPFSLKRSNGEAVAGGLVEFIL